MAYLLVMKRASGAAAILILVGFAGVAQAGPTLRFGLTGAVEDEAAPSELELGPMIGAGMRLGPVVIDADYAYLSFFEPDTGAGGMQRVGANLRVDLMRSQHRSCWVGIGCMGGTAVYAEAGAAERFGQWHLDAHVTSPEGTDRTHEEHIGVGVEMDNTFHPNRYGWQLGVRLAITPHDPLQVDGVCRGGCTMPPTGSKTGGQDHAVLVEWTYLLGQ